MGQDIRALNVGDFETLCDAIDGALDAIPAEELASMFAGEGSDGRAVGIRIATVLFRNSRGKLFELCARVRGITVEEMRELPAQELMETFKAIMEDPRNEGFFSSIRSIFTAGVDEKAKA